MATVVFTTCDKWPDLSESDKILATALQALGYDVQTARWQGDFTPFQRADLIISRTHYDYHDDIARFTAWLGRLKDEALQVYNSVELMRWNLDKHYLLDLQAQGVTIPVTEILQENEAPQTIYDQHGWEYAVIKPSTGASGYLVERVSRGELAAWQAYVRPQRSNRWWRRFSKNGAWPCQLRKPGSLTSKKASTFSANVSVNTRASSWWYLRRRTPTPYWIRSETSSGPISKPRRET